MTNRSKKFLGLGLAIAVVLMVLGGALALHAYKVRVHVTFSYSSAVEEYFKDMKENYALTAHKGIDWDGLYNKYMPSMRQADEEHDEKLYLNTLLDFSLEFHDSHVILEDLGEYADSGATSNLEQCKKERFTSCFDMAVFRLDNGRYVAVNVVKGGIADSAGIEELDTIISWNGVPIEEAVSTVTDNIPVYRWNYANGENEAFFKSLYLSCQSTSLVEVEVEGKGIITMKSSGNGYTYMQSTFQKLLTRVHGGEFLTREEGMMWYSMENGYVYMCVPELREENGGEFEEEIGQMVEEMKESEPEFLLLDLRNNSGGFDDRGAELLSYFVDEDMTYLVENTYSFETGEYTPQRTITVQAKGEIHLPVILLVNSQCVSAGEAFVYHMSGLSNVTVVGANPTNGSLATYEGFHILPGGVALHYPDLACMTEEGRILIDSDGNQEGGVDPDVRIPIDETYVAWMFVDDLEEDYEKSFAVSYGKMHFR